MRSNYLSVWVAGSLLVAPVVVSAQPRSSGGYDVRKATQFSSPSWSPVGVVEEVTEKSLTIRWWDSKAKENKSVKLLPIDRLAAGKLLDDAVGTKAYLWADMKVGDTVLLEAKLDSGEQEWYCLAIGIRRRPGDKLPPSQDPKNDRTRFRRDSVFNDIENGQDVSDRDIATAFPVEYHPRTGVLLDPGGLSKDWQAKLDAIRAKKGQDLKATPPDKK